MGFLICSRIIGNPWKDCQGHRRCKVAEELCMDPRSMNQSSDPSISPTWSQDELQSIYAFTTFSGAKGERSLAAGYRARRGGNAMEQQ